MIKHTHTHAHTQTVYTHRSCINFVLHSWCGRKFMRMPWLAPPVTTDTNYHGNTVNDDGKIKWISIANKQSNQRKNKTYTHARHSEISLHWYMQKLTNKLRYCSSVSSFLSSFHAHFKSAIHCQNEIGYLQTIHKLCSSHSTEIPNLCNNHHFKISLFVRIPYWNDKASHSPQ